MNKKLNLLENECDIIHIEDDGKEVKYYKKSPHLHFRVKNLEVLKSGLMYNRYDMRDDDYLFEYSLKGKASITDLQFSVIGWPSNCTHEFSLYINPIKAEVREEYLEGLLEHISRKFIGKVEIGYSDGNPEIQTSSEWIVVVYVTSEMLNELVSNINQKRIKTLSISSQVDKNLYTTNPWPHIGDKVEYCLRPSKKDNEIWNPLRATGNLDRIDMELTSRFTTSPEAYGSVEVANPISASIKELSGKVDGIKSAVNLIGGLIVFALIILVFVVK